MKSMSIEIFSKLLKFRLNEIYLMRSINKYILIMSKKDDKKIELESKVVNIYKEEQPTSQVQIQQQYVQLQTLLMLTQLNSAYYRMHLTIIKNLSKVENKYFSLKMKAFLTLANYKGHAYEVRAKLSHNNNLETEEYNQILCEPTLLNEANILYKLKYKPSMIAIELISDTKNKVFLKSKEILRTMVKILANKMANVISTSFYQLMKSSNENSTIKMLSDKSSKIQTIDSQKSKVFKRSVEKKPNRKSFSLQKSIKPNKNQYYVPVKYQAQNKISTPPILSSQTSSIQQSQVQEGCMTDFAKFLQKNPDPLLRDRRNLLSANRQRKAIKSTSSKKINVSVLVYGKEQKIRQLQYLQRKYKKLITEFNWFSDRFLKVIQEEAI